jgi:hypothetical protein
MTGDGRIRLPAGAVADGHPLGLADSAGGRLVPAGGVGHLNTLRCQVSGLDLRGPRSATYFNVK